MVEPIKGAGRCPKCASRKTTTAEQPVTKFYARTLEICGNCGTAWEPIDRALLWDPDDPMAAFAEPCNNCAFRPGSHEQQDVEEWKKTIASLKAGGQFFCHKGVPVVVDPDNKDYEIGFAYPRKRNGVQDPRKMRLCRGFLTMWGRMMQREFEKEQEPTDGRQDRNRADDQPRFPRKLDRAGP